MPSCTRNSIIVVFKTGAPPQSPVRPRRAFASLAGLRASIDDYFQERRHEARQGTPPQRACRGCCGKHRAADGRIVRVAGLFAQARATEGLRGFSALRGTFATDPGAILGSAAARQESGT